MAPEYMTFPSDMTLTGALALCLVIVVAIAATTAAALALGWGFTRLSPSGRADLVRFVRAARKLKVSGSRSGALRLEPLLHACQAVYPGIVDRRL